MLEFLQSDIFAPRSMCFSADPSVFADWAFGHLLVVSAYLVGVPLVVLAKWRQRFLGFTPLAMALFTLFVAFCGFGHLIEVLNYWLGQYRFEAHWHVATGIVSWAFCIAAMIDPRDAHIKRSQVVELPDWLRRK